MATTELTELTQKQVTSNVANRIEAMKSEGLLIAPNYSVSNALSLLTTP